MPLNELCTNNKIFFLFMFLGCLCSKYKIVNVYQNKRIHFNHKYLVTVVVCGTYLRDQWTVWYH